MRALPAALIFLVTSCHVVAGLDSFDLETGGGGNGAGGLGEGGTGGDLATGGAGGELALVERGVLARWFLDEAGGATTVTDAIAPFVDLTVQPNNTGFPVLSGVAGVRGVTWDTAGTNGYVRTAVADTKLETIDGKRRATIEIVMSLSDVVDGSRLVHYGAEAEGGRLSLRAIDMSTIELWVTYESRAFWTVDLSTPRLVVHAVYDSELAQPDDRAQLYVGGTVVDTLSVEAPIAQGLTIDVDSPNPVTFHIGNRDDSTPSNGRSAKGTFHYVALYDVALTAAEVATNAALLAQRDDP